MQLLATLGLKTAVRKQLLINLTAPMLIALCFVLLYFLFINRKAIKNQINQIKTRTVLLLAIIFVAGFALRLNYGILDAGWNSSPWEYTITSKYFVSQQRMQRCDLGSFEACQARNPIAHPALYSVILGSVFALLGYSTTSLVSVLSLQILIGSLTVITTFLMVYTLTDRKDIALLSSAFLAVFPLHVLESGVWNAGLSIYSVFFASLAIFLVALSAKKDNKQLYALSFLLVVATICLRMENLFLIPVSFLILIYFNRAKTFKWFLDNKKALLLAAFFLGLPLFRIIHIWGLGGTASTHFSLSFLNQNLDIYSKHFRLFFMPYGPLALFFAPLLLFGYLKKLGRISLLWFLSYTGLYLFFLLGPSQRYLLNTAIPLTFMFGLGVAKTTRVITRNLSSSTKARLSSNNFVANIGKRDGLTILIAAILLLSSLTTTYHVMKRDSVTNMVKAADWVEDKSGESKIIVPSQNTLWAILTFKSETKVVPFISLSTLSPDDKAYLLANKRCERDLFPQYSVPCSYLTNQSSSLQNYGSVEIYNLTETSENRLQEAERLFYRQRPG